MMLISLGMEWIHFAAKSPDLVGYDFEVNNLAGNVVPHHEMFENQLVTQSSQHAQMKKPIWLPVFTM